MAAHSQRRFPCWYQPVSSTLAARSGNLPAEFCGHGCQRIGGAVLEFAHGRRADGYTEQIDAQPRDPTLADPVRAAQKSTDSLEANSIAAPHARRQGPASDPAAPGAGEPVTPILGDEWPKRGNLDDLVD
jgi:hypothetical protein